MRAASLFGVDASAAWVGVGISLALGAAGLAFSLVNWRHARNLEVWQQADNLDVFPKATDIDASTIEIRVTFRNNGGMTLDAIATVRVQWPSRDVDTNPLTNPRIYVEDSNQVLDGEVVTPPVQVEAGTTVKLKTSIETTRKEFDLTGQHRFVAGARARIDRSRYRVRDSRGRIFEYSADGPKLLKDGKLGNVEVRLPDGLRQTGDWVEVS